MKVKITCIFNLDITDELYKKINDDEHKLEEFCIKNCFKNNNRTLRRVDLVIE